MTDRVLVYAVVNVVTNLAYRHIDRIDVIAEDIENMQHAETLRSAYLAATKNKMQNVQVIQYEMDKL